MTSKPMISDGEMRKTMMLVINLLTELLESDCQRLGMPHQAAISTGKPAARHSG